MKLLQKQVEYVLEAYPETRNSDKVLFMRIVTSFYDQFVGEFESILLTDLFKLPNYDTISRIRRKFQEAGKYQATGEVKEKRQKNTKKMRRDLGYDGGRERAIFDNEQLKHIASESYQQGRIL